MGVGMPAALWLNEFGSLVYHAFGENAYHVGSSVKNKDGWRDVDVRVMLARDVYERMGLGDPKEPHANARWCALALAFSALGKQMTGLPVDFQIQEIETANAQFRTKEGNVRSCLGFSAWGPTMTGLPGPADTDAATRQLMATAKASAPELTVAQLRKIADPWDDYRCGSAGGEGGLPPGSEAAGLEQKSESVPSPPPTPGEREP